MAGFEQWWEDTTDDTMLRNVRKNRERLWESLEDFISTAPAGPSRMALSGWAERNGVTPEEAERIAVLAERFSRFGKRVGDLS